MKKMIKNLVLVAVAAMGFTACEESVKEAARPIEPAEIEMTITADVDDTRTWIDEANSKVQWSEGDALKVIENGAIYRTTTATNIVDGLAKFTVSFPENTADTEFAYNAIYPAVRLIDSDLDNIDVTKVKVVLPEAQNPTATSFDPTADILVAKQIVTNAQPTELSMQFKRLVAMGKMTLTNLPASSTISKVIFTVEGAEENPDIAGRNYVDATTGTVAQYGYYGATNTITLNYLDPIATRDIYFTCNPFELVAGDKFTVKVVCSDATYTREVTLPAGRTLGFIEGDLSKFSVNMESANVETTFVFPDGEYAAIAVVNEKYYALSSKANGLRLNAVEVASYTPGERLTTSDATLKWTVNKTNGGYTFKGSNNQYIAWSSDNYAQTQDEVYYLDIAEDAENEGRYNVTSRVDAERRLQKNSSNPYFAFYTSNQSGSLYLVPVTVSETEEPEEPSVVKATIAEFLEAQEDSSTVYELTGTITSVEETTYGNFYMMDDTATVYIYGLCSPEGDKKYWAESGAKVGDDITVQTIRSSFNNAPQGKNAIFVNLVSPGTRAVWTFSKTSLGFNSDGGSETIDVSLYNSNDSISVSSNSTQFSANYAGGILTITANENNSSDVKYGTITVKAGELTQDITVTQSGVTVGDSWILLKTNTLQKGDQIVIVAKDYDYAMSKTQNTNNRASVKITKAGDQLTIDDNVQILTVQQGNTPGSYALYTGSGYLYAASSTKNHLKTETTLSNNSSWSIDIETNGNATIKSNGANTRNWLRFNNSNDPKLFSCYSTGQTDVVIYKLTNN